MKKAGVLSVAVAPLVSRAAEDPAAIQPVPVSSATAPDRRVTWIELFFDLVFVAAVAQVGGPLATHYSFPEFGRYAFLLVVIWWAWHGYAVYATRFDLDDRVERGATLLQMLAVVFMAANAEEGLDSVSSAGFAVAYAAMRIILVLRYLRAARRPGARRLAVEYAAGFGAAAAVWLLSSATPVPWRYALWATALSVDVGTAVVAARHTVSMPPHAAHLPERFGLFTLILLGEAIVAVMKGIQGQPEWSWPAAASAVSGVALVCAIWWAYFEGTNAAGHRHVRCREDSRRFTAWTYAHLPLYLGLALAGIGVERAVVAGGWQAVRGEEARLMALAVVLVGGALGVLGGVAVGRVPATAPVPEETLGERARRPWTPSTRPRSGVPAGSAHHHGAGGSPAGLRHRAYAPQVPRAHRRCAM
ncbi:MAG: low temperature requirement protein A [Acidobacteriota bacterium]|nr:low temperature requirement protein A [Acidobacteriota bacterium]